MIKKAHLISLLSSTVYTITFIIVYRYFLYHYFGYFGYELNNLNSTSLILAVLFSVFPSAFHRKVINISSFFAIMIYVIGYIPTIVILFIGGMVTGYAKSIYIFTFLISMILLFLADRINLIPKFRITTTKKISFSFVLLITFVFIIYIAILFRNNFKIVSFDNIYDLRETNSAVVRGNALAGYIILWLTYCFLPVSLIYGLLKKNYKIIFTAVAGHIIIFGSTASKASLLMPVIILSFYLLFKLFNVKNTLINLNISLSIISIVLMLLTPFRFFFLMASLLFMRTTGLAGLLNVQYLNFFEDNKFTYYSHINIINKLTHSYPYGNEPLGKVVGFDFYQNGINANANFWATDGIAALGATGIMVITLIIVLFLNVIDRLIPNKTMFIYLSFVPSSFAILNVSFFTALNSCGLFFLILILMYVKINPEAPLTQAK